MGVSTVAHGRDARATIFMAGLRKAGTGGSGRRFSIDMIGVTPNSQPPPLSSALPLVLFSSHTEAIER